MHSSDAIHLHVALLLDLPDHRRNPAWPISCYSLSLASCSCPTLHSCVSHSCNIKFLCFSLDFRYPDLMLCSLFQYIRSCYVCIRHVQIWLWFCLHCLLDHSVIPTLILYFQNNSSFHPKTLCSISLRLHSVSRLTSNFRYAIRNTRHMIVGS